MRAVFAIAVGMLLTVQAQVMLPHRHAVGIPQASETLPLQLLTNLPYSAYSVARKLNSSWTGTAYRVWRPSDSNTLDIGFSGNRVNTNALTTFCGTNSGYLDILYDQSGNAHHLDQHGSPLTSLGLILVTNGAVVVDEFNRPTSYLPSSSIQTYLKTLDAVSPVSFTNAYWFIGRPVAHPGSGSGVMVNLGGSAQGAVDLSSVSQMQIWNNPLSNANTGDAIQLNRLAAFGAFFHTNNVDAAHYNTNVARVFTSENVNAGPISWGENAGEVCASTYLTEMIYWNYLVSTNDWLRMRTNMLDFYTVDTSTPAPLKPALVWYKFNEGSGTNIADASGNGHNAGLTGGTWITGKSGSGYALQFNGTNDYAVSTNSVTYGTNVITVCAWVWEISNTTTHLPYASRSATFPFFGVFAGGTTIQEGDLWDDTGFTTGRVEYSTTGSTGAWFHWAIVYDNSTVAGDMKIYRNGTLVSTTTSVNTKTGSGNFGATPFFIGQNGNNAFWANMKMDDLRIYAGELSALEINLVLSDPQ